MSIYPVFFQEDIFMYDSYVSYFSFTVFHDCFARLLRITWIILGNKHLYLISVKFSHLKFFYLFILRIIVDSRAFVGNNTERASAPFTKFSPAVPS